MSRRQTPPYGSLTRSHTNGARASTHLLAFRSAQSVLAHTTSLAWNGLTFYNADGRREAYAGTFYK
jgi:hypothetical protein